MELNIRFSLEDKEANELFITQTPSEKLTDYLEPSQIVEFLVQKEVMG